MNKQGSFKISFYLDATEDFILRKQNNSCSKYSGVSFVPCSHLPHPFVPVSSCSALRRIMNVCHLFKQKLCLATFVLLLLQLQNCVHSVLNFYLWCYRKVFFPNEGKKRKSMNDIPISPDPHKTWKQHLPLKTIVNECWYQGKISWVLPGSKLFPITWQSTDRKCKRETKKKRIKMWGNKTTKKSLILFGTTD